VIKAINDWIKEGCKLYAVIENDELFGAVIIREKSSEIVIECIGVDNKRRGNGIGSELIKYIRSMNSKQIFAETDDSAIRFYKNNGFNSNRIVKQYKMEM
jgi:ribosomal protein S18 acetylase RimI-like enzyme